MLEPSRVREVALRLRRRHLRTHLQTWRNTRQALEAARRSRQKRARQLRLARKHHLRFCLKYLKEPGFQVNTGSQYLFFQHVVGCTREYLEGLQDRLAELSRQWRELRNESVEPLAANLEGLLQETDLLSEDPLEVAWTLSDVYLESVWIGDLNIVLELEEFRVRVYNESADTERRGGYQHPHVNTNGEVCWNGYDEEARAYHLAGDFLALKDLITNLLQTYNPSSPYITLDDWENGCGDCCADCGERYPEDDLVYIESRSESLCPECRTYCDYCDRYVSYRDFELHPDRGWSMCRWCVEEFTARCSRCKRRFLDEDLEWIEAEDEEDWLLCSACYEEQSRKEEEDNADLDDAESVLAASVAVPSEPE